MWFGRTRAGGRLEPLKFDDPDVPEEDLRFGAGKATDLTWKQVLDTFSCTECGRCQDACPAFATGKVLSPKLVIMGLRDQVLAQDNDTPLCSERCPGRHGLGLRDLRGVHPGLPGLDRARRSHRRPAPASGDGRGELPGRGGADAARRRARLEPVGKGAVRAGRVGGGARHARARTGRPRARVPLLGGLRFVVRRARAPNRTGHGARARARPASTSRSSGPARAAPAIRRAGSATSTCSRPSPSRTSRP